jgi:hypothetical protein
VIALGLAIELVAAVLVILALFLGGDRAAVPLWSSVAVVLLGLAVVTAGVRRARPPRRSPIPAVSPTGVTHDNGQR